MRSFLAVSLLGLCLAGCGSDSNPAPTPTPPQVTSISGTWTGTAVSTQVPGASFNISVVVTQTGSNVSGTFSCVSTGSSSNCAAPSAVVAGTLVGSALTAQLLLPGNVVACSSFNGTLSSNTAMAGNYACGNTDVGTWSLARP